MTLNLDKKKAFDFIEWHFLFKILKLLGFNSIWTHWIRQCLSSISFSILMDVPHLENSLHLVVEGKTILYHLSFLSRDRKYSLGSSLEKKKGKKNHNIKISRLDRGSLTSIKSCPNTYCIWWGKRPFSENWVSCLAKIATHQFKHPLFLPSFYPKKKIAFEDRKTKISNHISGWKSKLLLSQAGS
jgi:hypothetical protein